MKSESEKWVYLQSGKDRNGDGVRCEEGDEAKHSVNTALHLRSFNYLQFLNTYHHFYNQHKNDFHTGIKDEADIICISSLRTFAFEAYIAKVLESEFRYWSNSISRFQTSLQLKRKEWLLW